MISFETPDTFNEYKPYHIIAEYGGNANFTSDVTETYFTPSKVNTYGLTINAMNITVGDDEIITVIVPDHVDDVVIWVNGTSFRNHSVSGNVVKFNITHLNLKEGLYTVTATVNDTEFDHKNFTALFTVRKISLPMNITVFNNASIYVGDTVKVVVSVPKDVTENVTLEINNIRLTNVTVNGNVTFYIPAITYGNKTVVAAYIGDDRYYYNSTTANFTVNKRSSQVNVTVTPTINVGENATVSVKVPANATGYVIVSIGGNNYTINLTGGVGSVKIAGLKNNTYKVNVTYIGDDQYLSSINNTQTIKVNKLTTPITIDFNSIIIGGDDVYVEVNMNPDINGVVLLSVGAPGDTKKYNVAIVGGKGGIYVTNLANATYDIYAEFEGNDKYESNTSEHKTLLVNSVLTSLSITIDKNSINVGDNATIGIILNQSINAIVTVKVNGSNHTVGLVNGKGNFTLSGLANGTYIINAVFAGDDIKYVGNISNQVILKVNKIVTSIDVGVVSPVTYGGVATITVAMDPSINDYVVLNVAGKNYTVAIVNGKGKFNATGLNVGNYLVNVTYAGDNKYLPSSNDTVSFDVVAADLDASAIGLNVTVEEDVGIVIAVPSDFTGNVSVNVSGDIRYNDTVISLINIGQFKAGTYTANVTFYGDNNYNTKSVTVNFNVTRVTPSINVTIEDVTYPKDAVANIVIGNNANGTVNITVGKKTFIGTVENGVATVNLSKLSGGIHNATVEFFTGDDYNNNVTSALVKFLVLPNNSLISIDGAKAIEFAQDPVTMEGRLY